MHLVLLFFTELQVHLSTAPEDSINNQHFLHEKGAGFIFQHMIIYLHVTASGPCNFWHLKELPLLLCVICDVSYMQTWFVDMFNNDIVARIDWCSDAFNHCSGSFWSSMILLKWLVSHLLLKWGVVLNSAVYLMDMVICVSGRIFTVPPRETLITWQMAVLSNQPQNSIVIAKNQDSIHL